MAILKPNPFILIVDKDGDCSELLSIHSTEDFVESMLRHLSSLNPEDKPFSAFVFDGDCFRKYF